jgi:hypothetical protein
VEGDQEEPSPEHRTHDTLWHRRTEDGKVGVSLRVGADISVRGSSRKDLRTSGAVEGGKEGAEEAFVTLK